MKKSNQHRSLHGKSAVRSILSRIDGLSRNLWWTWNAGAQRMLAGMDPALWDATHHNPIKTLKLLAPERRAAIAGDADFAERLAQCERDLEEYLHAGTWFDRTYGKKQTKKPLIAYFCSEYAVHESLPQYSGGLGVLAGDHLKSASDLGVPLVAVGLLYWCGYYTQELRPDGTTRVIYPQLDFAELPITDSGRWISVAMGKRTIRAKIWKQQVGRVQIYLLDTDVPENKPADRALTRHLYGGDREYRIQQEILLGIGGMLALEEMGHWPTVFHLNEGHAAFAALERLRRLRVRGVSLGDAIEEVRQSGVFTTHTPVPAGNDRFSPAIIMKYFGPMLADLGMTREEFLGLGRENRADRTEEFCMTVLALRLSARCNGVAALHGETSRKMWMKVYGVTNPAKVPIGHVTNGIHSQTWVAPEIEPLYEKYLKPQWVGADTDANWWSNAGRIPAGELWAARNLLRRRMIEFVRQRLRNQALRQGGSAEQLAAASEVLDEKALTIGFARRFATYKRAPLIFHDARRLARLFGDPRRPVQIIFAGKAHPKDLGGQEFARQIHRYAAQAAFRGRVILLEDYDMELGRMLTSGCDVWLNNPLRPQEASGTSGMKGPLHGGLNCSIPDGWWPEAFNGRNGWTIGKAEQFSSQARQDAHDALEIYKLLEGKIVPLFYARDRNQIPLRWVKMMVESMKTVCAAFSSHRMVGDYVNDYYMPAHDSRGSR